MKLIFLFKSVHVFIFLVHYYMYIKKWHNISYYNTVALNLDASSFLRKVKEKKSALICVNKRVI